MCSSILVLSYRLPLWIRGAFLMVQMSGESIKAATLWRLSSFVLSVPRFSRLVWVSAALVSVICLVPSLIKGIVLSRACACAHALSFEAGDI
jgi:hypothetical protein